VFPIELAKGEPGKHYRVGWVEKDKAGASLVAPEPEHRYNLPEGMRYELGGRGLVPEAPASPGASQPAAVPRALKGDQL
jgi:ferredoxin-type protein NapG